MELTSLLFAAWITTTSVVTGGCVGASPDPATQEVRALAALEVAPVALYSPDEAVVHPAWDAFAD
jgi:hypothetical protein